MPPAETLLPDELRRYRRHLALPGVGEAGQAKLKSAKVLVVGTGGLGSPLALYLAAAGVGTLGLADFDSVEESNLQRQILHSTASVGRAKLDSARERLSALNPLVRLALHPGRVAAANAVALVGGYDVVADGSDNFETRYVLNEACVRAGKPLVHGSVSRFEGRVAVFWAGRGPCYRCLHPEPPAGALSCAEAGVLGALAGAIGSLQALEALKLVLGVGTPLVGRLALCDALAMDWRVLAVRRDPDCPTCGSAAPQPRAQESAMPEIPAISVEELKAKLDRKEKFTLIDVREPGEYEQARIEGSRLIPLATLPGRLSELEKGLPIAVHCRSGGRSARAVEFLRGKGYDAVNVAGGIMAWAQRIDPSLTVE